MQWWDAWDIVVAHFNHGQRKESAKEQQYILKHFPENTIYRNTVIPTKWLSETVLRQKRHEFFEDVLQEEKTIHLFLWHNLTDRIETTLMNMVRGSSIDGFLSIKSVQEKEFILGNNSKTKNQHWNSQEIKSKRNSQNTYTIYRPLITISKKDIQKQCDALKLHYFVDKTNNENITARNMLRNTIIPAIQKLHDGGEENRDSSWSDMYKSFDREYSDWSATNIFLKSPISNNTTFMSHIPSPKRAITKRYSLDNATINEETLTHFIKTHLKNDIYLTKKTYHTIVDFIMSKARGHIFLGWKTVWWTIAKIGWEGNELEEDQKFIENFDKKADKKSIQNKKNPPATIHFLFGEKSFWENKHDNKKKITHSWLLQFDHNIYSIKEEWIGYTVRYPQSWDIYKKKRLLKVLLNRKIPFFMRNTTVVIADGSKIVAILD